MSWVAQLPKLNQTEIERNDDFYRDRLRSLQAVDDLVGQIIGRLEEYGILNNTYIFYSSDNGYHVSQHRLQPGKKCGFEEDINVPLIVRGPGISEGLTANIATSHVDLAPTFLNILGIPLRDDFDGSPIPVTADEIAALDSELHDTREHVQVEFWGKDNPNEWGGYACESPRHDGYCKRCIDKLSLADSGFNNTYKSLRVIGNGYDLYYAVWCTNEHELYDMTVSAQIAAMVYCS